MPSSPPPTGTHAALVSASGKTSTNVVINAVKALATATRYTTSADHLSGASDGKVTAETDIKNLTDNVDLSKFAGSMTLNYGDRTISIDFGERELFQKEDGSFDAEAFQSAIVEKLKDQQISTSSGSVVSADKLIGVSIDDGNRVSFYDKSGAGNQVSLAGVSGSLKDMIFNPDDVIEADSGTFKLNLDNGIVEQKPTAEYLSGKTLTVTLDGKSQTITLPEIKPVAGDDSNGTKTAEAFAAALNSQLEKAFGSGRVSASLEGGALSFQTSEGSTLAVTASSEDVGDVLGIGSGLTTYLDTTKTLGQIKGIDWSKLTGTPVKGTG